MSIASQQPPPLARIGGWPVHIANQRQALCAIVDAAARGESFAAFKLNLDHLDKLKREPRFRDAYTAARFVTADGAPVAFLASLQGERVERTTGADLVIPLAVAAAEQRLPIYLFGTEPHILADAGDVLRQRAGLGLDIVGSGSPMRNLDPECAAADAALETIAASGAHLCFVALGAPKQEIFAARAVARDALVGFVCIGAGLDFLVDAKVRAPAIMQTLRLEWLWRLARDPDRLVKRYARCAIVLAEIALVTPAKRFIGKSIDKRAH